MDSSVSPKDEIWFSARVPSHFKRSLLHIHSLQCTYRGSRFDYYCGFSLPTTPALNRSSESFKLTQNFTIGSSSAFVAFQPSFWLCPPLLPSIILQPLVILAANFHLCIRRKYAAFLQTSLFHLTVGLLPSQHPPITFEEVQVSS